MSWFTEDYKNLQIRFTAYTETDDDTKDWLEEELTLGCEAEVCSGCNGKGTHVNRAIDGHGLTANDFYEDPGFRDEYFSGTYDEQCDTCHGRRITLAPKDDDPNFKRFCDIQEANDSVDEESAAERRALGGGY